MRRVRVSPGAGGSLRRVGARGEAGGADPGRRLLRFLADRRRSWRDEPGVDDDLAPGVRAAFRRAQSTPRGRWEAGDLPSRQPRRGSLLEPGDPEVVARAWPG